MLTKEQAELLCEAHEIGQLLESVEEVELLEKYNPELLEAYIALYEIAQGAKKPKRHTCNP